jgi:hypothetical protein
MKKKKQAQVKGQKGKQPNLTAGVFDALLIGRVCGEAG